MTDEVTAPETDNPETTPEVTTESPGTEAAPDWPEDWRDKAAAGDEKFRKQLDRFRSPADLAGSYRALRQKMSSGELSAARPGEDASDEERAEWRKDNGIPDSHEAYLESLPDGLVVGEADKPLALSFAEALHKVDAPPAVAAAALGWYYKAQDEAQAAQAEADKAFKARSEDALRGEWGNEYRGNINSIRSFLDAGPADEDGTPLVDLLLEGRLANGSKLGDNPTIMRWLAQMAYEANPAGFISPGTGKSQAQGVADEIAGIEKTMRENRNAYDKDEKMQARLRDLYAAQERLSAKG